MDADPPEIRNTRQVAARLNISDEMVRRSTRKAFSKIRWGILKDPVLRKMVSELGFGEGVDRE